MKLIAKQNERQFWLVKTAIPFEVSFPFGGRPFVCVILSCDESISSEQQAKVSNALVINGCRYALAWGKRASSWDDSVDWAHIQSNPDFNLPADRMVMTTWHDNESIAEVIWFAVKNTNFGDHDFHVFVALMIGEDAGVEKAIIAAVQHEFVMDVRCEQAIEPKLNLP